MHPVHNDETSQRRSLLNCYTAKTSGFLVLALGMMRRKGMKDALKKVLITNVKLTSTLNYKNKPIFQYFPVLSHYLTDGIFLSSRS